MAGSKSSKSSLVSNSNTVAWLLALTVCYQLIYQGVMWYAVRRTETTEQECSAVSSGSSPRCMELQLFQSWKRAELDDLRAHGAGNESWSQIASPFATSPTAASALSKSALRIYDSSRPSRSKSIIMDRGSSKIIVGTETGSEWSPITHWGNWSPVTKWGKSLQASQQQFEARMENLPSVKRRKQQERQAEFERLYNATLATINNRSPITLWAQDVMSLQHRLQEQLNNLTSINGWELTDRRVGKSWDIIDNAHASYFNLKPSAAAYLKKGDKLKLNGKVYDIQIVYPDREYTFIQVTEKHGAQIGDRVAKVEKGDNLTKMHRGQRKGFLSMELQKQREREAAFDKLYDAALAAINNRSPITPWAQEVMSAQNRLQEQLDHLNKKRQEVVAQGHKPLHREQPLLEQIYEYGRELCAEPHRRDYPSCARFLAGKSRGPGIDKSFSSRKQESKKQLQSGSEAKASKAANMSMDLAQKTAAYDARIDELRASKDEWESTFSKQITTYMLEMCADSQRSDYSACAGFLSNASSNSKNNLQGVTEASNDATSRSSLRGARQYVQRLRWSSVASWKQRRANKGTLTVGHDDLRFLKWQGKIPKVACVSVVPPGRNSLARMKYFVNNFQLQSYSGPRQLVLVYDYKDSESASAARSHADGMYIKAVAAQAAHFPSTEAFRYGAWASDNADVIAQWNFDEWHHPDRLSLQINALALTSQPVSTLGQWLDHGNFGSAGVQTMNDELGLESSIVGEAKWMHEHWMPLLAESQDLLRSAHAGYVVRVDVPAISVYGSLEATESRNKDEMQTVMLVTNSDNVSLTERLTKLCSSSSTVANATKADSEKYAQNTTALRIGAHPDRLIEEIDAKLGNALGNTFRVLVARQDEVARNLTALCTEAIQEHDSAHREALLEHVERIRHVQQQLEEHFITVNVLIRSA